MKTHLNAVAQGKHALLALVALVLSATAVKAQLPTGVTLVPFYDTTDVSFARDSVRTVGLWEVPGKAQHFFVLDQNGQIFSLFPDTTRTYTPGQMKKYSKTLLANFKDKVKKNLRSEMGAWSLAFHPNYKQNHYFYVMYFRYNTVPSDNWRTDGNVVVERWITAANHSSVTRDTTIYSFYHPASYGVSSLAFGLDGYLYMATSVYSANGWSDTTVHRKILRVDVNNPDPGKMYGIPASNPLFNSTKVNVKKEIYASGLRNVWSMSFNRFTGKLWAGDVGQDLYEEVNIIEPGANYGWANGGNSESSANGVGVQGPCPSGFSYTGALAEGDPKTCASFKEPDWSFAHTGSTAINCIVVGPAFSGDSTSPYYGYHFVTDVQRNQFWAMKEGPNGTRPAPQLVGQAPTSILTNTDGHNGIVQIGEDSYGNLYATMVSWYFSGSIGTGSQSTNPLPNGQKMFHEIYRLSHPQLMPRATPIRASAAHSALPQNGSSGMWLMNAGASRVDIPLGYSGVEVYNLKGRLVWSYRGQAGDIQIPSHVEKGILRARLIP